MDTYTIAERAFKANPLPKPDYPDADEYIEQCAEWQDEEDRMARQVLRTDAFAALKEANRLIGQARLALASANEGLPDLVVDHKTDINLTVASRLVDQVIGE